MKEKQNKFTKLKRKNEYLIHYKDDATAGNGVNMISLKVKVF